MSESDGRGDFDAACEGFEVLHRDDPRGLVAGAGETESSRYHRRMAAWLDRLHPQAAEELRLAVRAQHVCRWRIPRTDYPEGRLGYLAWRNACKRMHAEIAGQVLATAGYGEEAVRRVQDLVQKRRLASDPEAQALEDVACLVFLESYLADFVADYGPRSDEAKLLGIVSKTWDKMSPRARQAALALELPPPVRELVAKALGG